MIAAVGDYVLPLITLILGGGGVTAYVSVKKSRPEIESIQVDMSKGVLLMQKDLMVELQSTLDRSHDDNEALRASNQELRVDNEELRRRVGDVERQMRDLEYLNTKVSRLEDENRSLKTKNAALEARVAELEHDIGKGGV